MRLSLLGRPGAPFRFRCHRFDVTITERTPEELAPGVFRCLGPDEQAARERWCIPCAFLTGDPGARGCSL